LVGGGLGNASLGFEDIEVKIFRGLEESRPLVSTKGQRRGKKIFHDDEGWVGLRWGSGGSWAEAE